MVFKAGLNAFTEFFKVSPDSAKPFAFFETKNEEFYNLLSKHAMKALGIITNVVSQVICMPVATMGVKIRRNCNNWDWQL